MKALFRPYGDFRLGSVMRDETRNVSLGILGRVYVLKSDFRP